MKYFAWPRWHRHSIRLKGFDYAQPGMYFVTICARNKEWLFGEIQDGKMELNEWGRIVEKCWYEIPKHFEHVSLNEFVIMPNHVHGIISIHSSRNHVGARHAVPLPKNRKFAGAIPGSLSTIIGSFKSAATKRINESLLLDHMNPWQRNFYEHIIRNMKDLNRIRTYIKENPAHWENDEEFTPATQSADRY